MIYNFLKVYWIDPIEKKIIAEIADVHNWFIQPDDTLKPDARNITSIKRAKKLLEGGYITQYYYKIPTMVKLFRIEFLEEDEKNVNFWQTEI